MAIIKRKCWPEFFKKVMEGKKNYDIRHGSTNVKAGDTLVFQEFDPETKKYTGRSVKKKILRVSKTKSSGLFHKVKGGGFAIISFD